MASELALSKHIFYFKRCIDILPDVYEQLDTSRMTLLYFALSGLDILNALDSISLERKQEIVKWIYSLQINADSGQSPGFRGGFCNASISINKLSSYDVGHLAMTYSALACLKILGDNLSQVCQETVMQSIKSCQLPDGSFCGCTTGSENDLRFVYCAVASCHLLNNFSPIDLNKLLAYVKSCLNYDGGFGQTPGSESHGGSTYCAVATLHILDKLHDKSVLSEKNLSKLKRWCVARQNEGFFGRPNKPDDSCYTFWISATLKLIGGIDFVNADRAIKFTLSTQDHVTGGFGKYPELNPDLLHTYLGLAGLSLLGFEPLSPLDAALNITQGSLSDDERMHGKDVETLSSFIKGSVSKSGAGCLL